MLFLLRDTYILDHGMDRSDLSYKFREEVYALLSTSCTLYINNRPITNLPNTFPEKVDDVESYMLQGTSVFEFKWHDTESIIRIQEYKL